MIPVRSWFALIVLVAAATTLFELIGVPSAPLFGGLVGGLVQSLGMRTGVDMPNASFRLAQGVIGVTTGAMIDWGRLRELGWNWPAVAGVCIATLLLSIGIGQLLRLHKEVSASTAVFSTVAGGASGMTAIASDYGADDRVVTVIQYLRVLVILSTLPIIVSWATQGVPDAAPIAADMPDPWRGLAFTVLAAGIGITVGTLLRLPSPAILGGIAAGAALATVPWFEPAGVPNWVRATAFLFIGVQVGLRFTRKTLRQIARMMPTAFIVIGLIIAACALLGLILSEVTGVSRFDAYLATTPGGLPAVLAATSSTGGDVTFVSTVQLLRILIVLVCAPFIARWTLGRRN